VKDLLGAWRAALPPGAPATAASRTGADLLARWSEPHRHYHTTRHLAAVLAVVDDHAPAAVDPHAVRLAAWFHDAVYDPARADNEEASALLAESVLPTLQVGPSRVAAVARLVRLTATHAASPGDRDAALLMDADLAILAAPPETYRAYTAAVRREYAHVDDASFTRGRAAVLATLLALPRLFHLPVLHDRWEAAARRNVTAELAGLGAAPPRTC
jgi:predicted metal-dependent HD superfamily phosphohydrolase